jgi:tyrosinase
MANLQNLGYTYDNIDVSLSRDLYTELPINRRTPYLRISGIDRSSIAGSFIISAWAKEPGKPEETFVGYEPVFSRWHVSGCVNCNNHLKVTAYIPLGGFSGEFIDKVSFGSRVGTSDGRGGLEIEGEEHMITLMQ